MIRLPIPNDLAQREQNITSILLDKRVTENLTCILIEPQNPKSTDNKINTILPDSRGKLWIGSKNGLKWLKPVVSEETLFSGKSRGVMDLQKFKAIPGDILSENILHLMEDNNGSIWISTRLGLARIENQTKDFSEELSLEFKDYPGRDFGQAVLKDVLFEFHGNSGNKIWIGRSDYAFTSFDPVSETFTNYDSNRENDSERQIPTSVLSIYRDGSGVIWLGTARHGLYKYDPQKNGFSNYHPSLEKILQKSPINLRFVFEDSKGFLWLARERLYRCNRFTGEIVSIYWPPKKGEFSVYFMNAILEDRFGYVWIAREGRGLYRFNVSQNKMAERNLISDSKFNSELSNENVTALTEDSRGFVWAAATKKVRQKNGTEVYQTNLFQYKPAEDKFVQHRLEQMDRPYEFGRYLVYSIHADASSAL